MQAIKSVGPLFHFYFCKSILTGKTCKTKHTDWYRGHGDTLIEEIRVYKLKRQK